MSKIIDKVRAEPVVTINAVVAFLVALNEFIAGNVDPVDGWKGVAFGVVTFVVRQLVTPNKKVNAVVAKAAAAESDRIYLSGRPTDDGFLN